MVYPVAHTTASTSAVAPSAKVTVRPAVAVACGLSPHVVVSGQVPGADSDALVPPGQPPPESGVDGDPVQPRSAGPPPHVATERPLRDRRDPCSGGELDLVGRGELLRDLAAGVRGADHQHPARGQRLGVSVTGAVHLVEVRVELVGDRRG